MYATSPSPDIFKGLLSLKAEYDILAFAQVEDFLLKLRSTYYEHRDKASRLLVHSLRQAASSHFIHPSSAASPEIGWRGQQLEQRNPDVPVPTT